METSFVKYGTDPSAMSEVIMGNISKTYTAADMCNAPANDVNNFVDPGYIHDVLLNNLIPGTRYYYSYGSKKVFFAELNCFVYMWSFKGFCLKIKKQVNNVRYCNIRMFSTFE